LVKGFNNIPVSNGVLSRVEPLEWSSNLHQLPALRLESRPDRAVGQLGMLMRFGVRDASVEQPGVQLLSSVRLSRPEDRLRSAPAAVA
jgi:hypothetical protein